ncbi:hypothetical protein NMD10_27630 (plasmid) [Citrobacter portucalensis]|uniref:hypothetical protein n=1 Tax=Citrobacter portucalensis TaxID=1639133 RepID=UPI0021C0C540|nr:hypothetical protein [Leclercia adecarboxylata ATCC 23216 = NBRC 102595]
MKQNPKKPMTPAEKHAAAEKLAAQMADKGYTGTGAEAPPEEEKMVRRSLYIPKSLDDALALKAKENAYHGTGPGSISALVTELLTQALK